jgi:hypothetical protein
MPIRLGSAGPPAPPKLTPAVVGDAPTMTVQRWAAGFPPSGSQPNFHSCGCVPASRTKVAPSGARTLQLASAPPQRIPAGELVTTPEPETRTSSRNGLKVATSELSPATASTVHGPVPQLASPQLTNVRPAAGVAVPVTRVPGR